MITFVEHVQPCSAWPNRRRRADTDSRSGTRLGAAVLLCGSLALVAPARVEGGEQEITYTNSFDGSTQSAMVYVPAAEATGPRPLIVVAHYMGGNRRAAAGLGYYAEMEKRNWLLACPELHGHRTPGPTSLAAVEAQHDIIDVIAYMRAHYAVDRSRIYLAGRSMGGMLAAVVAAKYPDLFAGVVGGEGLYDLEAFVKGREAADLTSFEEELLPLSDATRFDYSRRSALAFARNLQYVPFFLWHGTNDRAVPATQSSALVAAIRQYTPYQPEVDWLYGASHNPINYPAAWICDRLQYCVNTCDEKLAEKTRFYPRLSLVLDEPLSVFWLRIVPAGDNTFAEVDAELVDRGCRIDARGASRVEIELARVPEGIAVERCTVNTDTPLTVMVRRGGDEVLTGECAPGHADTVVGPGVGKR